MAVFSPLQQRYYGAPVFWFATRSHTSVHCPSRDLRNILPGVRLILQKMDALLNTEPNARHRRLGFNSSMVTGVYIAILLHRTRSSRGSDEVACLYFRELHHQPSLPYVHVISDDLQVLLA